MTCHRSTCDGNSRRFFFFNDATAPSEPGPRHYRGFTIAFRQSYNTLQDFSGRVISPAQRSLPDNTQHSEETDIHAPAPLLPPPPPGVNRTLNPRKRAVANLCRKPRGHWDRQFPQFVTPESPFWLTVFRLSSKSVRIFSVLSTAVKKTLMLCLESTGLNYKPQ